MRATQPPPEHYIVPARQLSGTRDEVLAQIDELILGLTGLRQLVAMHGPKPAEAPPRKLRLVRGFLKVLLLLGIALWASPVRGQTGAAAPTIATPQPSEGSAAQEQSDDLWRGIVFGATIETFYQGDRCLRELCRTSQSGAFTFAHRVNRQAAVDSVTCATGIR